MTHKSYPVKVGGHQQWTHTRSLRRQHKAQACLQTRSRATGAARLFQRDNGVGMSMTMPAYLSFCTAK